MMKEKFKLLEHTADIKFQAFGKTKEEAYQNSFLALKKSIFGDIDISEKKVKKIFINGDDDESLLYSFLEEFLYLLDAERFIVAKIIDLKIEKNKLTAKVGGDDSKNYNFTNHVKAITYNEMFIKKEKGKWILQVVLDV